MAGRERSGAVAARGDLFDGRAWVVVPHDESVAGGRGGGHGAGRRRRWHRVDDGPGEHDAAVAVVSHVPQLASSLVAGRLRDLTDPAVALSGQGIRDVTRIAASDPQLWTQILAGNAAAVREVLAHVHAELTEVIGALDVLADGDGVGAREVLARIVAQGNAGHARIPGKHGAAPTAYSVVVVLVPDQPGELARLLHDVGDAGVNLEDLHLEHGLGQPFGLAEVSVLPGGRRAARRRADRPRLATARLSAHPPSRLLPAMEQQAPRRRRRRTLGLRQVQRLPRRGAAASGVGYLDTGAMYRAVTWWCLEEGVDLDDQEAVAQATRDIPLEMGTDPTQPERAGERSRDRGRPPHHPGQRGRLQGRDQHAGPADPAAAPARADRPDRRPRPGEWWPRGATSPRWSPPTPTCACCSPPASRPGCGGASKELHGHDAEHAVEATRDQIVRRDADDSTVSEFIEAADGVHARRHLRPGLRRRASRRCSTSSDARRPDKVPA